MSDLELVDLGASGINEVSGALWVQAKGAPVGEGDAPDYGKTILMPCLGIAARPAPANEDGSAQGVCSEASGIDGICIGGHDPRAGKVYGEIQAGESAFFATGQDFDSRALAKKQQFSIIVGDDMVIDVDRNNKQIVLSCPGGIVKVSESDGIVLCDSSGSGSLQLSGGVAALLGQVIVGGRSPIGSLAWAEKIEAQFQAFALWVLTGACASPGSPVVYASPAPQADLKAPGITLGG